MGAFTTALSYALWAKVLPSLTPIEAGTFQLLVPLLTAFAGIGLLGEPFTPQLGVAGALVLAGMWLTSARRLTPVDSRNRSSIR
jgi:drug/metabolite transporter (DMT)-like permease